MTIEQQKENSPKFREVERVSKQVKEELKRFNKEKFYDKNGEEIVYNMDTVKQYLGVLKEKKTWNELISKNSSAMIMAVQIALYSQNYSFGTIDGILGERTKTAIRKFQADNNLPVDTYGRSMPSTIQKLLEVVSREDQVEIPEEEKKEAKEIMEEKKDKGNPENSDEGNIPNKGEITDNEVKENNKTNNEENQDKKQESNKEENNKTKLNQNIIHPEIEELIKSPTRNSEKFKELTTITTAEAEAISKMGGNYIELTGIKEILPETFEFLLKYKGGITIGIENLTPDLAQKLVESGKGITFSGLENISMDSYKILGNAKGTLRFKVLKNITGEEIGELIKKPGGDIYLDGLEEINPEIAEKIAEFPRDILLDGVKKIDKETVEVLSKKKTGRVYLRGLETPLSEDILEELSKISSQRLKLNTDVIPQIYNYKKQKEREGKDLSQIVLNVIDREKGIDELSKLDHITKDDAKFLVNSRLNYLNLSGIREIETETFETLLNFKWGITIGIKNLTPNLAQKLVESGKGITFSGLENISMDSYKTLGNTKGTLRFKALKNITWEEMGELIKKPGGDIYLDGLEEINPEIAEKIAEFPRDILLDGVKKIDKETVKNLSKKTAGRVYLRGLEAPLPEDILEELSKTSSQRLKLNTDVMPQIYRYRKQKEELEKNN